MPGKAALLTTMSVWLSRHKPCGADCMLYLFDELGRDGKCVPLHLTTADCRPAAGDQFRSGHMRTEVTRAGAPNSDRYAKESGT